jgi:hypothetical protein
LAHFQAQGAPGPLLHQVWHTVCFRNVARFSLPHNGQECHQIRHRRMLVVDAELKNLQQICNALRSGDYKVVPTSGYLAAVNTFRLRGYPQAAFGSKA